MTHDYHEQTTPYQAFLFERLHRATTSRLVITMFVLTIILLFLLLMYDLLTGTLSFRIMKMLIVSTLLLIYVYVIICMIGKWNKHRHLMMLPHSYLVWMIVLLISCIPSMYQDLFVVHGIQAYVIPIVIAFVILVVATTHYIRMRIRANRYHRGNDILL